MPNLVGAGDSITRGSATAGSIAYLASANLTLNGTWGFANEGVASIQIPTMIANAPAMDALYTPGINNVLVVWAGTNDMAIGGATPAATYANLVSYCQARQAVGWKVLVCQMLSRGGTNPIGGETMDADKNTYNALIAAGWPTFALGYVTFNANITADGAYSNLTYILNDLIHPTVLSVNSYVAPAISAAVNSLGLTGPNALMVANFVTGGNAGGAGTIPLPAISNSTGGLLVVHARFGSSTTVSSVTDTAGNTYISTPSQAFNTTHFQFWYCPNAKTNPINVITITLSGTTSFTSGCVWEVASADLSAPFDVQAWASNTSGSLLTSSPYSTVAAKEIILGSGESNAGGFTYTQQSGYTLDSSGYISGQSGAEHLIVNSLQTNVTTSMTLSTPTGTFWGMHVATFKASFQGGGGSGTQGDMLTVNRWCSRMWP